MNLLLVRHGMTDWADQRLAGWLPGIHLNEQGRREVEALGRILVALPLAAVYSSPLERALETAHPVATALGLPIVEREGLGEVRCGDWSGRRIDELAREELWAAVQQSPERVRFPGGESLREAQARITAEIESMREDHPGQLVAAFSHADPIKLAVAHYAGIPLKLFQRLVIRPASVTAIAFAPLGPRLLCLNYTAWVPTFQPDGVGAAQPGAGSARPDGAAPGNGGRPGRAWP